MVALMPLLKMWLPLDAILLHLEDGSQSVPGAKGSLIAPEGLPCDQLHVLLFFEGETLPLSTGFPRYLLPRSSFCEPMTVSEAQAEVNQFRSESFQDCRLFLGKRDGKRLSHQVAVHTVFGCFRAGQSVLWCSTAVDTAYPCKVDASHLAPLVSLTA